MTQTALAADLDLTKVAVGGLLDRLEAAGFTERRADKRDGRAKRIYLTSAGTKIISTIRRNVEKTEEAILSSVSNADLQVTAQTLVAMKRTLLAMLGGEDAELEDSELAAL
jgi:DNA-binding MarR family transcriptional regulator